MGKDIDFTVKNDLAYGRGYVYSLQYHLVWCTKYRKKVLRGGIDTECREMLEALAQEYKFRSRRWKSCRTTSISSWTAGRSSISRT